MNKVKFVVIWLATSALLLALLMGGLYLFNKSQKPPADKYSATGLTLPAKIVDKGLNLITLTNPEKAICEELKTKDGHYTDRVVFSGQLANTSGQWQPLYHKLTVITATKSYVDQVRAGALQPHEAIPDSVITSVKFGFGEDATPNTTGPGVRSCQLELWSSLEKTRG